MPRKRSTPILVTIVSAGALLALAAVSHAAPGRGFLVHGTLVSFTADNPATAANEGTVTLTVTKANTPARKSGAIADQDASKPGVQVAGATYTVATTDPFVLKLNGYKGSDTPSVGDAVMLVGKITGGTPNVRRVILRDRDPDT